jgi:hypothetical protein
MGAWLPCWLLAWLLLAAPAAWAAPGACDAACQAAQLAALRQLYGDLSGPTWARQTGWSEGGPPAASACGWAGVKCCNGSSYVQGSSTPCPLPGGVAALELPANGLRGPWPGTALSSLSDSLVALDLRSNQLTGSIDGPGIGSMSALTTLLLDHNKLSGPLPGELGQLPALKQLSASGNSLSGPLPAALGGAQQLQWLLLERNQLTGALPPALLQLQQLQVLNLQRNRLSGQLPDVGAAGACVGCARVMVLGLDSACVPASC